MLQFELAGEAKTGRLSCFARSSGKLLWKKVEKRAGVEDPDWGTLGRLQAVLNGCVILELSSGLVALSLADGEELGTAAGPLPLTFGSAQGVFVNRSHGAQLRLVRVVGA